MGLTRQQADCLRFIASSIEQNGCAPTYEEMQVHLGQASKSGVYRLVTSLERRGAIRRMPNLPRAIEVLPTQHALAVFSDAALLAEVERRGLR